MCTDLDTPAQGDISYVQWVTCLIWKELLKGRAGKTEAKGEPDKVNVPVTERKRR